MKKGQAWFLVLIMLLALANRAWAQETEPKKEPPVTLEPVVVVGTPILESSTVDRYGQEHSTIGQAQINALNAGDLTSALRCSPGVDISRYDMVGSYGGGDGGAIYLRGMGSARPGAEINILFDGVPLQNPIWSHPLIDTIGLDAVKDIQIYKSPQPVFFGNNSFGVINIIPRQMDEPGSEFTLGGGGGSYGTWFEKVNGGASNGVFDGYFAQSVHQSDGFREHSAGYVQSDYGRAGYKFNDNLSMSFSGIDTSSRAQDPGPDNAPTPKRSQFNVDDTTGVLSINDHYDWGDGYLKVYADNGNINWEEETDDSRTPWVNYGFRARQTVRVAGLELMGGVDGSWMGGKSTTDNFSGPEDKINWEVWSLWEPYLAASYKLEKNGFYFIPSAGIREGYHSEFDDKTGWQAGVVAGYKDLEMHFNQTQAYNYPGQYARFFYQSAWASFYNGDEWKDLKAETMDHWEAGGSYKFQDKGKLSLTWFEDRGKDGLYWMFPPPVPPRIVNIGESHVRGLETSLLLTPLPSASLMLGYTDLMVDKPHDLPRAPAGTFNAGLNVLIVKAVRASVDYVYVTDQYVGDPSMPGGFSKISGYDLINAKVAWEFHRDKVKGSLWVAAENLGNAKYEYLPHYPMPRQTWMGGMSIGL